MLEALAGAGLGVLVGLLLGLSVTELVGNVVTALTALLVAFLGLRPARSSPGFTEHPWKMVGFGFACSLALLAGVSIRANNLLARSPAERFAAWRAIQMPPARARELTIYEATGIRPAWAAATDVLEQKKGTSALFATAAAGACDELEKQRFSSSAERRNAYELAEGEWALAARLAKADPAREGELLDTAWTVLCND